VLIDGTSGSSYYPHLVPLFPLTYLRFFTFVSHLCVRGSIALGYLVSIFGTQCVLSSKMTLTMPSRWTSQCLHPDEGRPQVSTQNHPPLDHPSTQVLSTITEGPEHPAFDDTPVVQLHQLTNNMSTTAPGLWHPMSLICMIKLITCLRDTMSCWNSKSRFKFWSYQIWYSVDY
jgi:hypothetical protein